MNLDSTRSILRQPIEASIEDVHTSELMRQAAFLMLVCAAGHLALVTASDQFSSLSFPAPLAFDIAVIGLILGGAHLIARRLRAGSPLARVTKLAPIVLLYLLISCQVLFFRETSTLITGGLIRHSALHPADTWKVVAGTSVKPSSIAVLAAWGGISLAALVLVRMRRLVLMNLLVCAVSAILATSALASVALKRDTGYTRSLIGSIITPGAGQSFLPGSIPRYAYAAPQGLAPPYPAPNIVVIILESARYRDVVATSPGQRAADMPNLARLASQGINFHRAYTTTSHTSKALVGILCGIHPHPGMTIREAEPGGIPVDCLPRLLDRAGFSTLFIQSATQRFENRRGLVSNMGFVDQLFKEDIRGDFLSSGYFGLDEMALIEPFRDWWIAQGTKPRFAAILTSMSHHPYQMVGRPPPPRSGEHSAYRETLEYADELIGAVVGAVAESGDLHRTVIIVTGDHGESFGEHGPRQHDLVPYEEGIHVPLVLYDGRGDIGTGSDRGLRQHIDVAPTVLELIQPELRWTGPGHSLLERSRHDYIVTRCWYDASCAAYVSSDLKWILFPRHSSYEAYDLGKDPMELENIGSAVPVDETHAALSRILLLEEATRRFYAH